MAALFRRRTPPPKTNRRQFLFGRAALDAMEHLVDEMDPDRESGSATASYSRVRPASAYLMQFARRAMACEFTVYLNVSNSPASAAAAIAALDDVARLEQQLSVYREDSEISDINRFAAAEPVAVERGLFQLLVRSRQLYEETHAAFDITAGPLSKAWGFHQRQGRVPTSDELQQALALVGSSLIELHTERSTVRFLREGVEINLGAIGKGYALDQCADRLHDAGQENFVVHGGSSSVLARGSRADAARGGWQIDVRHPLRPALVLARVTLRDQAVGTSGSAVQHFHVAGRKFSHIIDPRNGIPADRLLSSTVVAPDAATADALGTAFFIMGADAAQHYCREHSDVGALLIRSGERTGDIVVDVVNLGDDVVEIRET